MDLPVNKFKKAIAKGETQYGLWAGIPDTTSAEICAGTGFDWLLLDGEHAPFDMRAIYTYLQAIAPYDIHPIVRAVKGDKNLIKQLLDFGAQTLLIPMVDTAEQAEELVQAMRYPPEGIRGMGSSIARAARWNAIPDYLQHANDEICLLIQAESTTALENLPEILKVEGVDGVFIGPSDLSASMGHVG
ncbi:MAG: 4-hydroxy-2-oxoheptanedioate aldolase, partial [Gammaproteobacteria bacterium]